MSEREALLALTHVNQLGPVRLRLLLEHYGSAESVLAATLSSYNPRHCPTYSQHLLRPAAHYGFTALGNGQGSNTIVVPANAIEAFGDAFKMLKGRT